MIDIMKQVADYYKKNRNIQKSTSYTTDPQAKIVEDMTHHTGMHMYENMIDGTGYHMGAYSDKEYMQMIGENMPHARRKK